MKVKILLLVFGLVAATSAELESGEYRVNSHSNMIL